MVNNNEHAYNEFMLITNSVSFPLILKLIILATVLIIDVYNVSK